MTWRGSRSAAAVIAAVPIALVVLSLSSSAAADSAALPFEAGRRGGRLVMALPDDTLWNAEYLCCRAPQAKGAR